MLDGVKRVGMLAALLLGLAPAVALAQSQPNRADPSLMRQEMREDRRIPTPAPVQAPFRLQTQAETPSAAAIGSVLVGAVHVEGAVALPASAFGPAIEPFLGRQLGSAELRELANAI